MRFSLGTSGPLVFGPAGRHVLRRLLGGPHHGAQILQGAVEHARGPGLDDDVAERGRFGRAGQHARRASAVSWHSRAFWEPPPTMWMVRARRPVSCSACSTVRAYAIASESSTHRTMLA